MPAAARLALGSALTLLLTSIYRGLRMWLWHCGCFNPPAAAAADSAAKTAKDAKAPAPAAAAPAKDAKTPAKKGSAGGPNPCAKLCAGLVASVQKVLKGLGGKGGAKGKAAGGKTPAKGKPGGKKTMV